MGHEATTPIVERGFVRGANLALSDELADGAARTVEVRRDSSSSPTARTVRSDGRSAPPVTGTGRTASRRGRYFASPRHAESWIETGLGIPDASGNPIAGYGWVIPVGDGTVNVGVGLLSTYRDVRGVNALKLLDAFAQQVADRWQFDPAAN